MIQFNVCKELSNKLLSIQDKIKKLNKDEWGLEYLHYMINIAMD